MPQGVHCRPFESTLLPLGRMFDVSLARVDAEWTRGTGGHRGRRGSRGGVEGFIADRCPGVGCQGVGCSWASRVTKAQPGRAMSEEVIMLINVVITRIHVYIYIYIYMGAALSPPYFWKISVFSRFLMNFEAQSHVIYDIM